MRKILLLLLCASAFAQRHPIGIPSSSGTVTNGGTSFTTNAIPKASSGTALTNSALSDSGSAVTSSEVLLGPNGSASVPTYGFTNCTNCGMLTDGTNVLFTVGGGQGFTILNSGINLFSTWDLSFNADTYVSRSAAGTVQIGTAANNASGQLNAAIVNAGTGFQVNGAAASNHILLGNGTNYVDAASVPAAAMPALTGDCTTSAGAVAVTCTQINGANLTVNTSGVPTKVAGVTTAGEGVAIVQCVTSSKTETGADATLLSCTPASAATTYEVCVAFDVSAANTATFGWTMTWTNSKGNANAPTNMPLFQMGVAAPALTFTAAANNSYYSCVPVSVNNAGTAIVVKTTFTGTSIAYNATAVVKRVI